MGTLAATEAARSESRKLPELTRRCQPVEGTRPFGGCRLRIVSAAPAADPPDDGMRGETSLPTSRASGVSPTVNYVPSLPLARPAARRATGCVARPDHGVNLAMCGPRVRLVGGFLVLFPERRQSGSDHRSRAGETRPAGTLQLIAAHATLRARPPAPGARAGSRTPPCGEPRAQPFPPPPRRGQRAGPGGQPAGPVVA
jgi:hypothetical protein